MFLTSARMLTGASYGMIALLDGEGQVQDFLSSGLTGEEAAQLWEIPDGLRLFEHLASRPMPLRIHDMTSYVRSSGFTEFQSPVPVRQLLAAPVSYRGRRNGFMFMAKDGVTGDFSREDEETLIMFASQAAMLIANARRIQDERQARAKLETLVSTSPVGVVVFDVQNEGPPSFNREAARIVDSLRTPGPVDGTAAGSDNGPASRRPGGQSRTPAARRGPLGERIGTVRGDHDSGPGRPQRQHAPERHADTLRGRARLESLVVTMQDMSTVESLERLRTEFLAMVSHELRTPLTSIKGSVDTLLEASPGPGPRRDEAVPPHHPRPARQHAQHDQRPPGHGPHRVRDTAGVTPADGGRLPGGRGEEPLS